MAIAFFVGGPGLYGEFGLKRYVSDVGQYGSIRIEKGVGAPVFVCVCSGGSCGLREVTCTGCVSGGGVGGMASLYRATRRGRRVIFFLFEVYYVGILGQSVQLTGGASRIRGIHVSVLEGLVTLSRGGGGACCSRVGGVVLGEDVESGVGRFGRDQVCISARGVNSRCCRVFGRGCSGCVLLGSFSRGLSVLSVASRGCLSSLGGVVRGVGAHLGRSMGCSRRIMILGSLVDEVTSRFLFGRGCKLGAFLDSEVERNCYRGGLLAVFCSCRLASGSLRGADSGCGMGRC